MNHTFTLLVLKTCTTNFHLYQCWKEKPALHIMYTLQDFITFELKKCQCEIMFCFLAIMDITKPPNKPNMNIATLCIILYNVHCITHKIALNFNDDWLINGNIIRIEKVSLQLVWSLQSKIRSIWGKVFIQEPLFSYSVVPGKICFVNFCVKTGV